MILRQLVATRHETISKLALRGPVLALGAALLFGAATPLAKALLGGVAPWMLAGLLYLGAGAGLTIVKLAAKRKAIGPAIARADWPWLILAIAVGGGIAPVLLVAGLSITDAATSSLLLTLEGVFTALMAWIVFREHVQARLLWGMGAIALGAGLLAFSGRPDARELLGPALVAAACLCWALDNNLTRKISLSDAVTIAQLKGLFAGVTNLALALAFAAAPPPQAASLIGALFVGFLGFGVSVVLFVLALRDLGTARTGAYFSTAPFLGAVLAVLAFSAPVTLPLLAAGLLMGAGVWLHLTERHSHEHAHEILDHAHLHVHDDHHQHEHAPDDPPGEPHHHPHRHPHLRHAHDHFPDAHHRHDHKRDVRDE